MGGIFLKKKEIELSNKQKFVIGVVAVISIFIVIFLGVKIKDSISSSVKENKTPEVYTVPEKEKIIVDGKITPLKVKNFFIENNKSATTEILIEDGQQVAEGQLLFTYKNEDYENEIDSLKNTISLKESQLKNIQDDTMKSTLEEEISRLYEQVNNLEEKTLISINAPFSGKVYLNSQTSSNSPDIVLESDSFYVSGHINENDLSKVNLNQEVKIFINSTKDKFKGKIDYISERPSNDGALSKGDSKQNLSYYDIKTNFLDNQDLKSIKNGFHAKTTIEVINTPIKVPYTSLLQEDEKKFVYKVIDGIVYKQEVKTGEVNDEYAIITDGVGENDQVIKVANNKNIKEGENIYPNKVSK